MGAADIVFPVYRIFNICIDSFANDTADVAGVIKIISCFLIAMNIAAVRYIF